MILCSLVAYRPKGNRCQRMAVFLFRKVLGKSLSCKYSRIGSVLLTKRLINAKITEDYARRLPMDLGEAIRITRQKALYTQEDFAQKLNVALSTVNRWELNKAKPNMKAMKAIKSFCEENEQSYEFIEKQWLGYSEEESK